MSSRHSERVIGIDLGTTNSCLAILEHGQPKVIDSSEGGRTTPSVVSFFESGERVVGLAARRQEAVHPERTISSVKRLVGRKLAEIENPHTYPYALEEDSSGALRIRVRERLLSPEEISAMILAKLKSDAEEFLGERIGKAVVTVPAYFNDAQRQATKDAAEIAGLDVMRLVNEPTAAALAYGFNDDRENRILVFDLGGGTFDVSVLEIGGGVFEVLATAGDNALGGDDFDAALVADLVADFRREEGLDLSLEPAAMQRLYEAAERAKIELSTAPEASISLPYISANSEGPVHLERKITRAQLQDIVEPLLKRLEGPTQRALEAAGLRADQIEEVLLVGGMTRMPAVSERVRAVVGRDPRKGVNPDEAVALGAAIQAGIISGAVDEVLLLDVIPMSLGIETRGGVVSKLIEANTTIPARETEVFTTAEDNQSSVEVHVLQGEREFAADNRSLGRVQLLGIPPAPASVPQIEVTFDIDANGILSVTARDLGTDNVTEIKIEASTGLGAEEVERMRAEAESNRAADLKRRKLVEARNEGELACSRARSAIDEANVSDDERASVKKLLEDLEQLLAGSESSSEAILRTRGELLAAVQDMSANVAAAAQAPISEGEEGASLAQMHAMINPDGGSAPEVDVEQDETPAAATRPPAPTSEEIIDSEKIIDAEIS